MAIAVAGMSRYRIVVGMSASGGGVARTGKSPSCTPTTTTRMVPVTNSGIDDEVTPTRTMARSDSRSRRRAAYRAGVTASGDLVRNANPATFTHQPLGTYRG